MWESSGEVSKNRKTKLPPTTSRVDVVQVMGTCFPGMSQLQASCGSPADCKNQDQEGVRARGLLSHILSRAL